MKTDPGRRPTVLPPTPADRRAITELHGVLLVVMNAPLLAVFAFACASASFDLGAILANPLPLFLPIAVPTIAPLLGLWLLRTRAARHGRKLNSAGRVAGRRAGGAARGLIHPVDRSGNAAPRV